MPPAQARLGVVGEDRFGDDEHGTSMCSKMFAGV